MKSPNRLIATFGYILSIGFLFTLAGCPMTDTDGDGVIDATDNCPNAANADQADADNNGVGDACDTPTTSDAFNNADAGRGGALYDEWWAVTGATEPSTDHPLWASRPDTTSNTRTGADTWRCKECHGWDYKGVDGAYGSGSHRTGIKGLFGTTKTAQEVFDAIKNSASPSAQAAPGHDYGTVLSDADIWDLAKFVLEGQIDTDTIISSSGLFTGDAATGLTLYSSGIGGNPACMICHGTDGLSIPPGAPPTHDEWVGLVANENPWEFQHKVRFGLPGVPAMPAAFGVGTTQDVADLGTHAQTLPTTAP